MLVAQCAMILEITEMGFIAIILQNRTSFIKLSSSSSSTSHNFTISALFAARFKLNSILLAIAFSFAHVFYAVSNSMLLAATTRQQQNETTEIANTEKRQHEQQ